MSRNKRLTALMLPVALLLSCLSVRAQEFKVRSFRPLPNDITAYIAPVRDLNDEACALLKVVCEADFAFSTPLGIVQRKNDVGEIWLYVPQGTRLLTIKHPRWGVLRDYRFPRALESRLTYELVLTPPLTTTPPVIPTLSPDPLPLDTAASPAIAPRYLPQPRIKRPKETLRSLLLAGIGIRENGPSFGIRMGLMRRHGAYLLLQSDFGEMPDVQGTCQGQGIIAGGEQQPYYTGRTTDGRHLLIAGAIHRLWGDFCLYEGVGYGRRQVAWETVERQMMRHDDYSLKGWAAEAGGIYRFRRLALSAGAATIGGKQWEATLGIGIHFHL